MTFHHVASNTLNSVWNIYFFFVDLVCSYHAEYLVEENMHRSFESRILPRSRLIQHIFLVDETKWCSTMNNANS